MRGLLAGALIALFTLSAHASYESGNDEHESKTFEAVAFASAVLSGTTMSALTAGGEGAFHLTANDLVYVDLETNETFNTTGDEIGKLHLSGRSFGAGWKHFFGSFLYGKAGLNRREINYSYYSAPNDTGFDGTSYALAVSVGAEFYLLHALAVGIDFIGLEEPFLVQARNERLATTVEGGEQDRLDSAEREALRDSRWRLLFVYAGFSF